MEMCCGNFLYLKQRIEKEAVDDTSHREQIAIEAGYFLAKICFT